MKLTADKTTFDGVLRLGVVFSSAIKTLQETIVSSVSGQVPVVERHMHITLAGIGHLKAFKSEFKKVEFPPYTSPWILKTNPGLPTMEVRYQRSFMPLLEPSNNLPSILLKYSSPKTFRWKMVVNSISPLPIRPGLDRIT